MWKNESDCKKAIAIIRDTLSGCATLNCSNHGTCIPNSNLDDHVCTCDSTDVDAGGVWSGKDCQLCNGLEIQADLPDDCDGIALDRCNGNTALQRACPTTCAACFSTTTATTTSATVTSATITTTTRTCNGKGEPPECGTTILQSDCALVNFLGKTAKHTCPATCGTCVSTTVDSATTPTTTTPTTTNTATPTSPAVEKSIAPAPIGPAANTTTAAVTTATTVVSTSATAAEATRRRTTATLITNPTSEITTTFSTATTLALQTTSPRIVSKDGLTVYTYSAIGGGAVLLVLGISIACCCLRKQKLKRLRSHYRGSDSDTDDDVQLLDLEGSSTKSNTNTNDTDYFDPHMTLQQKAITFGEVIGKGNFGKVHVGTTKDPQRGGSKIAVAIKSPSAHARPEFEAEMEIMGQLTRLGGHPHIVGVVGCVYGNHPLLVLEFCAGGSLKAALTAARTFKDDAASDVPRYTFETNDLTMCAYQVALAMAFLEHHKLLHRDLAARNVLLTGQQQQQQLECKLADFGLSRLVAPGSDYYRRTTGKSAPIPVRWMAPETLDESVSTINSDKWSFGVLLWEIYSLGLRPYIGVENHEMAKHLRLGHRLDQPPGCPDEVYAEVMQQCWAANPAARPAFVVVSQRLHGLIAATN